MDINVEASGSNHTLLDSSATQNAIDSQNSILQADSNSSELTGAALLTSIASQSQQPDSTFPDLSASSEINRTKPRAAKAFDISSEEAFPALGAFSSSKDVFATQWGKPSNKTGLKQSAILSTKKNALQTTEIIDLPLGQINPRAKNNKDFKKNSTSNQKLTVSDIVRQIMSETSTQIEVSRAAHINTMTFIISGEAQNVSKAKREVCSQLSPHVSIVLQIPAILRRFLIGTKGQTLSSIQLQSGAQISLPSKNDREDSVKNFDKNINEINDEDLMELIDITINGDVQGVAIAKAAIEDIVSKKTSKRGARLTDIPSEYNTFIAGSKNKQINQWMEEFPGLKIRVPLHFFESSNSKETDSKFTNSEIFVSGEREAVSAVIKRIQDLVVSLRSSLRTIQINLPKRQHKFIIGTGGTNITDIFDQTECSVEIPPIKDESTLITIRGPQNKLMEAMAKVMEQANAYSFDSIDFSLFNSSSPNNTFGSNLLQYLKSSRFFKNIEKENDVNVYFSNSSASSSSASTRDNLVVELVSKDQKALNTAKSQLLTEIKSFEPAMFDTIEIEPHLHGYLVGRNGVNAAKLKSQFNVLIITPSEPESLGNLKPARSSEVILVYEGLNAENSKNKKDKTKTISSSMASCKQEIEKIIREATNFGVEIIDVLNKFHRNLIGAKGASLKELLGQCGADENEDRVYVDFGAPNADKKDAQTKKGSSDSHPSKAILNENQISVKGNKKLVTAVVAALKAKVKDIDEYDTLHSFHESCSVSSSYLSRIIGKGGSGLARINKIHDVQVEVADPEKSSGQKIAILKIKGTKKGVQDAKNEIEQLIENIADQTTKVIQVPSEYHRSLIGSGGRFVRRLEDRYGVSIQFPSSNKPTDATNGQDATDIEATPNSTEDVKNNQNQLKKDEIMVRGGSKGVEASIKELVDLVEYERSNNYSESISVPRKHLGFLVGRNGSKIAEIRDESNARIDIESKDENSTPDSLVKITLTGTTQSVKSAKKIINEITAELDLIIETQIKVDPKHHGFLIGSGGAFSRELITECGGDSNLTNGPGSCKIFFPRLNSEGENSNIVRIVGDSKIVNKVSEKIMEIAAERDTLTTISVEIPQTQHAYIIGKGGMNLRQLQDKHKVQINFPSNQRNNQARFKKSDADPNNITIVGKAENCELAKKDLLSLVRETKTVIVPLAFHRKMGGRESQLWRNIFMLYNVNIDAPKVEMPKSTPKRIDDKPENGDYTITDVSAEFTDPNSPQVEWLLKGETSQLEKAETSINEKLKEAKENNFVLTFEVDSSNVKFIIGKGGSTIQAIRVETGAQIDIPKQSFNKAPKNLVTLTGSKEAVLAAKAKIDQSIEDFD
ncbi:hypothetical protein BB561_004946 [Smittium simulii]|uniref:K Homology domain-containing protein n=1 Tax=Smittium simulii TaxID=133385 RepID=A0A2T9YD74_9FUNG|nr:hypothetical protein BB561_004946 [Smittium simulii]